MLERMKTLAYLLVFPLSNMSDILWHRLKDHIAVLPGDLKKKSETNEEQNKVEWNLNSIKDVTFYSPDNGVCRMILQYDTLGKKKIVNTKMLVVTQQLSQKN